jgi:autotransporter-associated beta strand protein
MNIAKGNNSETFGALAGSGTVQGHPGVSGVASTIIIGNGNGSGTFSGTLSNGGASGATLSVTKTGSGTQILTGTNSYTGTTTISSGVLQIGNGGTTGSLSASSVITNNASLVFNRSDFIT